MEDQNYFTFLSNRLSIRRFLSLCLLILVTSSILILGLLNYYQMKRQNEHMFKMQMINGARAVDALLSTALKDDSRQQLNDLLEAKSFTMLHNIRTNLSPRVAEFDSTYQYSFAFQVYDKSNGRVVLYSTGAPTIAFKSDKSNEFETVNITVDDSKQTWYIFSMDSRLTPYRIVVFVSSNFKHQVFLTLFHSSLWDLLVLYIFLLLAMLVIVQIALRPLDIIRRAISVKNPRKLEPITVKKAPPEVMPLLNQLNLLFRKFYEILEKEKRFSGDAAHELKTPLAALKTQAEVALNLDDIDEVKERIKRIIKGANRYSYIIDQLLTLSRLEPQQELPDQKFINFNQLTENELAVLALSALEKEIELAFMPSTQKATVYGSEALLSVLVRNLIDNAIRYTPEAGKVTIYTYVTNKNIIFEVIDSGIGVRVEKLNRIFDRFYRQAGTGEAGSGLGLSIAKEIVRLHDGRIEAISQGIGTGMTMRVILPHASF
ncbi:MAG: ATP-binding protein [Francisellaceae bacterium]